MSTHTPERNTDGYVPVKVHEGRHSPANLPEPTEPDEPVGYRLTAFGEALVATPPQAIRALRLEDIPEDPFNPPAGSRFTAPATVVEEVFAAAEYSNSLVLLDAIEQARTDVIDAAVLWADGYPDGRPGDDDPAERRGKDGALRHAVQRLNQLLDEQARRTNEERRS